MDNIYQQAFTIRASEIDQYKRLRLDAFAALMQEVAWEHASLLKVGKQFFDENRFWVLSRLQIHVNRLPIWGEEVVLRTWPKGIDKFFALRDFEMKTREGEELVSATSAWLIMNETSRRPIRPDEIIGRLNQVANLEAIAGTAPKIESTNPSSLRIYTRTARVSDLDMNGHVNNVTYLRWALDSLYGSDFSEAQPFMEISINYLSETFLHEVIDLSITSESKQSTVIAGISSRDQRKVFMVRVN
ncbi:acyl-[acyl-carrier-protein] thioesterase [Fulvivirgaceae bacterium LMO-SS25]